MRGFVSKPFDVARLEAALLGEEPSPTPTPQHGGQAPVLDAVRVRELVSQLGPALVGSLAHEFAAEAENLPAGLAGSNDERTRAVHNLRGSAANLGLLRAVTACDDLRNALEGGLDPAEALKALMTTADESAEQLASCANAEAA